MNHYLRRYLVLAYKKNCDGRKISRNFFSLQIIIIIIIIIIIKILIIIMMIIIIIIVIIIIIITIIATTTTTIIITMIIIIILVLSLLLLVWIAENENQSSKYNNKWGIKLDSHYQIGTLVKI